MDRINLNVPNDVDFTRTSQRINEQNSGVNNNPQTSEAKPTSESDKVSLSDRAATVGKLVEQGANLPDIRQDKVDRVRAAVQSGSFNPSSGQIADAIIKEEIGG
jgi:negative regulator of flagellin synthesis FlgM